MRKDSPQAPRDGDAAGQVSLRSGERVCSTGALEEEEEARKWAEKAAKLSRAHVHHDAGWDAVARDPKKTDWWGRRARFRSGKNMTKIANDMQVLPGVTDASRSGPPDEGYVISLLSR